MVYKCDICNKTFDRKFNYLQHKNKKTPCRSTKCPRCEKDFMQYWKLKRHLNRKTDCKTNIMKSSLLITGDHNTATTTHSNNSESYNNTNSNNITVNNHFHIRPFGKESRDHVTFEKMKEIARYATMPLLLFKLINLNKKHPENHNIHISNIREKIATVKKSDGTWEKMDLEHAKRDIMNSLEYEIDNFFTKYKEEGDIYGDLLKNKIEGYLNTLAAYITDDHTTQDMKLWLKKLELDIINNKKMLRESMKKELKAEKNKKLEEKKKEYTACHKELEGEITYDDQMEDDQITTITYTTKEDEGSPIVTI